MKCAPNRLISKKSWSKTFPSYEKSKKKNDFERDNDNVTKQSILNLCQNFLHSSHTLWADANPCDDKIE